MKLNRILSITAASIFVFIIILTAFSLISLDAKPGKNLIPVNQNSVSVISEGSTTFTKLGQLRISTLPDEKDSRKIIVLQPILEYQARDKNLFEELDTKTRQIKELITDYFSSQTLKQINQKGELIIKQELLKKINSLLVLGKVENIYFNEYQFL